MRPFALGFLAGAIAALLWSRRPIEDDYDPFALPYGEVVTLNHMLGNTVQ
jgi:hypothetical protein